VDTDNYILWTKSILKFESTDLSRVTKRLERFYNVRFYYAEPLLGGVLISGKLQLNEDLGEVCERIASAASVKIIKKEKDLYEIVR
jgi:ferric-dicitrate binding protein FerR (iron transport regulator)